MLYEDYLVTRAEIIKAERPYLRKSDVQARYVCELERYGHKIGFELLLDGCVGAPEYNAQYEAVAPHIQVGEILHCEFAMRWHHSFFGLCLAGFMKSKSYKIVGQGLEEIGTADYFNANRGYWVTSKTYGEWIRPPQLINLHGEAYLPVDFEGTGRFPRLVDYAGTYKDITGALVWKPRSEIVTNRLSLFSRLFRKSKS